MLLTINSHDFNTNLPVVPTSATDFEVVEFEVRNSLSGSHSNLFDCRISQHFRCSDICTELKSRKSEYFAYHRECDVVEDIEPE